MSKKQKINIKVGNIVQVIAGSYKNKSGEILKINKKTGKVIVKGINFKFKHMKPKTENEMGEIRQFEMPIHHSNLKLN